VLSEKLKSAITRKRPVELVVTCEYNRDKRQSSKVAIKTIVGRIGGFISRQGRPLNVDVNYVNKDGEIETDENVHKELGK